MSATISLTDTSSEVPKVEESMFDSGISSVSLRLTMPDGATSSQASSFMTCSTSSESHPTVVMPGTSTSLSSAYQRQDSGVCSDLMGRLSLSGREEPQESSSSQDIWKEFYEPDDDGDVQLHLAIASGYLEIVEHLIRMAPSTDFLNIQNNQMYAPLHIAVLRNHPVMVRRLVVAGARLDVRDREGNTPLHLAARRGHAECGEALLKPVSIQEVLRPGADSQPAPHLYSPAVPVDIIDMNNYQGENCVHLAAMGGHVTFLQFLCWNNADMNAQEGRAGRTALHFAVGSKNLTTIQCLLEPRPRGCGVNPNLLDWYGRSAYQLSIINSYNEVTHYLSSRSGIDFSGVESEDSIDSDLEADQPAPSLLLNSNA